jgi:PhzF family phenazine biosynthesis protein
MQVLRYAAFTSDPAGGNPAGVVLDASGLDDAARQRIATDVGFSETAFLTRRPDGELDARYFSPRAEVPFCGHATIAAAVAHAERNGEGALALHTPAGLVRVQVAGGAATLTSVPTSVAPADDADVDEALAALRWRRADLEPALAPRVAFAGAHHLVLAVHDRAVLAGLAYDYHRLEALMAARDWTTLQLVHRTGPASFDSRNPFPPGGVVEDPATGAAAAALGAYLRALGAVDPPVRLIVRQGVELGRRGEIVVDVPPGDGAPVSVTGRAVAMPG